MSSLAEHEHKRSSDESSSAAAVAVAVAVTPEKPIKKQRRTEEDESLSPKSNETEEHNNDDVLTAESIMGFPRYPNVSNGEIMKHHYDFVLWAKKKKAKGDASGALLEFVEWVESPEGQQLEPESEGDIKFGFGKHKGKTFMEVAQTDQGYHERYMHMLRRKGEEPNGVLSQYISWFTNGGVALSRLSAATSPPAAARSSSVALALDMSAAARPVVGSPAAGGPPAVHLEVAVLNLILVVKSLALANIKEKLSVM